MAADRHAHIMERLLSWARVDENVRAVIVTGSSARSAGAADRFSDRDVELVARDPAALLEDDAWIHAIAPVWVALYLENEGFPDTRLVFFEDAHKVDFTIADPSRVRDMVSGNRLNDLYQRGYRVLLDKDGLTNGLPEPSGDAPVGAPPTANEFTAVVTEFWFEAAHMPTYLIRGDLWVVKSRDWTMKEMLLRMIEWHAIATTGPSTDVWYIGTRMTRWVNPAVWSALDDVFGHFDAADSWRAIEATMRLFARLTHEVADRLELSYPEHSERHILEYVLGMKADIADERVSGA
jgi:aminoglycoside 6-adenylyltransferase